MNRLPSKILAGVLFCAATSFAVPSNAKVAISEASTAGQFLFLTFYKTKDALIGER